MITKIKTFEDHLNEEFTFTSIVLGTLSAICFYKFLKGLFKDLRWEDKVDNKNKLEANSLSILNYYINRFIKNGGDIEFTENYLHYIFKAGEVEIKIDKEKKTIFWTNIVADTKKFGNWKAGKRRVFTDIDVEEYEYTEPIKISQEDIDGLVESMKK